MFSRRDLVKLLGPLIIEQILNVLVGMVDVMMVAAVGETAVSGVSLVDAISLLIMQLMAALATGGAVVCSQYIGKQRPDEARRAAGQLVLITTAFALGITAFAMVGNRWLLGLIFGQVEASVMDSAVIYFRFMALSYPFLAVYNSCAALFRSMGNSKVSMKASFAMNALNVAGNAFCIYGLHMGVEGVAIPTLLSRMFAAVLMLVLIRNPEHSLRITSLHQLWPRPDMIRKILIVGIPGGLESGMFQFGKVGVQSLVSTLGTTAIASFAVASNLVTFQYLPGTALGLGMTTIVGRCVGAGEKSQAKEYARKLVLLNYGMLAGICLIMTVFNKQIVGIYNLSPEASALSGKLILAHTCAMIIWPVAFTIPHALRAGLDNRFTMVVSVFSMWTFRIIGAYVFVKVIGTGVMGVWYGMFIDWAFRAVLYFNRFRGFEKRMRQI